MFDVSGHCRGRSRRCCRTLRRRNWSCVSTAYLIMDRNRKAETTAKTLVYIVTAGKGKRQMSWHREGSQAPRLRVRLIAS